MLGKAFWSHFLPSLWIQQKGSETSFRRSGADPPSSHPMGADLSAVAMFRAVPLDDLHPSVAMTRRFAGLRGRNALRLRCDGHLLPFRRAFHGEGGRGPTRDHLAHFVEEIGRASCRERVQG